MVVVEEITALGFQQQREGESVHIAGDRDAEQIAAPQFGSIQTCVVAAGHTASKPETVVPDIEAQGDLASPARGRVQC
jgi:hypothetical protein